MPKSYLLLADEGTPEHADALAQHIDLKVVDLLEPVDDLPQGRIVLELNAVPERPVSVAILALGRCDGLREAEEGECQVDEPVLVRLNVLLPVDDL